MAATSSNHPWIACFALLLSGLLVPHCLGAEESLEPVLDKCTLQVGKHLLKPVEITNPWRVTYRVGSNRFLVHDDVVERVKADAKRADWTARADNGLHLHWLAAGKTVAYLIAYKTDEDGAFDGYESPARLRRLDLGTGKWLPDAPIDARNGSEHKLDGILGVLPADDGVFVLTSLTKRQPDKPDEDAVVAYEARRVRDGSDKPVWTKTLPCDGGERPYTGGFVWGITIAPYADSEIAHFSWLGDRLLICPEAMQPIYCMNPETGTEIWRKDRLWEFQRGFTGPSVWSHHIGRFGLREHDATKETIEKQRKSFDAQYQCALVGGPASIPIAFQPTDTRSHSIFVATAKGPAEQWAGYLSECDLYELQDSGEVISTITLPRPVDGSKYAIRPDGIVWKCQKGTFVKLRPSEEELRMGSECVSHLQWMRTISYRAPVAWLCSNTAGDPLAFGNSYAFCLPDGGYVLRGGDGVYHFPITALDLKNGTDRTLVLNVPFKGTLLPPTTNYQGGAGTAADGTDGWRSLVPYHMAITHLAADGNSLEITIATDKKPAGLKFELGSTLQDPDPPEVDPVTAARERAKLVEPARLNETLQRAASTSDLTYVKALLAAGADPKWVSPMGWTALMDAASDGTGDIVDLLIAAGSNVNAVREEDGASVALWAANSPRESCRKLKSLVKAGANLKHTSNNGRDAIMWATGWGTIEGIEYLVQAGLPVSGRDHDGKTALMEAASGDRANAVSVLIAAGSDVNAKDNEGMTVLMQAAKGVETAEVVTMLLKARADPNIKDQQGRTALQHAQSSRCFGSEQVVELLKPVTTAK